ncbi:UvrD-helicase domain-containing protein [Hyphobacterium marinum]|uniref:DNA 3'-5' helicase n=1 Tax=Hyphobacterium marinum TaxID=3116574 RepID=A0ABU7LUH2_9PROT|nr:UvrD-helicase domain-containing protein [Hyphobacterium sp. Y6023]MEE2565207.1 UvrD-helicase domain-containing protein [Hyphobacterium sp. Y6023]
MTPAERATLAQIRAADPGAQIFVEANAGSGKTRVLVDRVARLLLAGAAPDKILCLTYTKAAAGEMKSRLFDRLGSWSVMPDAELSAILEKFGGGTGPAELAEARKLFALALETPGGLAVKTIHAFCESLLRRFPLEAGVPPGFEVADDIATAKVLKAARADVLLAVKDDPELADALAVIASRGADRLGAVFGFARNNRHTLGPLIAEAGLDAVIARQYRAFGLEPGTSAQACMTAAWDRAPQEVLVSAAQTLDHAEKVTDRNRGKAIAEALTAASPEAAYAAYLGVFFIAKGEGNPHKTLLTKDFAADNPGLFDFLTSETDRMEAARARVRAAQIAEGSAAALRFADAFIRAYASRLEAARRLDFSDLIDRAGALLRDSEAADWVRYRMDGGIDHILVDEAQDTGPDQWAVIDALADEFFGGGDPDRGIRTLFCVGDEKQSIYSFQGADPKGFISRGARLLSDSELAGLDHDSPPLAVSFRSASEILEAVDRAFTPEHTLGEVRAVSGAPETKFVPPGNDNAPAGAAAAFTAASEAFAAYRNHEAARAGTPGTIDIWPPVTVPPRLEDEDPTGPVDRESRSSSRGTLARLVADEVARILADGDAVWAEAEIDGRKTWVRRPAGPGDIIILVRERTAGFFDELIRQLKLRAIPVAGADQMVLRDQIAAEDLLGVARAALNPNDDLALAEVLKSPFFQPAGGEPVFTEDALFDLAHDRPGTLWSALEDSSDPRFAEAADAMRAARGRIETAGVYGFFSEFLTETSATGESRLKRLFARLGEEARDPVEEFLSRALAHESEDAPSLTRFVAAVRANDGKIKREMEEARSDVRVMTVHASKGLEAPIVILPDTTRAPRSRSEGGLVPHGELGVLWPMGKDTDPPLLAELRAQGDAAAEGEYTRLLYVALTRARDRLLVCGWKHGAAPGRIDDRSWHDRLWTLWNGDGWTPIDTPIVDEHGKALHGRRCGETPYCLGRTETVDRETELPDWALTEAAEEHAGPRPSAPSRLAEDEEPPALSPLLAADDHRFRRGNLIHKLLQTLPDLAPDAREASALRYLERQPDLTDSDVRAITAETLRVLDHAEFAPLFGPGSRAEVAISGTVAGLPVRGQIDRLVVTSDAVLIIDYKTNRPPPHRVEDVAPLYLAQMAAYRALLQAIHPGRPVRCALLWTDGPRLMELPAEALDAALPQRPAS